jgi:2-polyprenyl-3-methyl-5-hydroxy-6-metoxy-1,4-benzoquinol methylase
VQGSVTRLPFADGSFDTVYSFKVLAHVEQAAQTLAELARVVKPGGHLVLEYYNRTSLRYLVKRLKPAQEVAAGTTDEHVYTRYDTLSELASMLPPGVEVEDVSGIRIAAPVAGAFNLPGVGRVVEATERLLSRSPARRLGGFLILILKKRG